MSKHPRFSLAKALSDVDKFAPLSAAELNSLVSRINEWMDETRAARGDVIEFAKRGEIGPRKADSLKLD